MLITLDRFIKAYTVRKPEHVENPRIFNIKDFVMPKNSHLHFLEMDGESVGILPSNPLLAYHTRGSTISEFVQGYHPSIKDVGGYKKTTTDVKNLMRNYYRSNKTIVNGQHSKSGYLLDKNLLVTNYGLLEAGINYYTNTYSWWLRFQNKWASIFQHMNDAVKGNRRNHFVFIDIPEMFPSVSQMRKFETDQSNDLVKKIANTNRMMVCQFWNWLTPNANTIIPEDPTFKNRVFIIFRYQDSWLCVNLAKLYSFMKTPENPKANFDERVMKRKFIIMLLSLIQGSVDDVVLDDEVGEMTAGEIAELDTKEDLSTPIDLRNTTHDHTLDVNKSEDDTSIEKAITSSIEQRLTKAASKDTYDVKKDERELKEDKLLDGLEKVNEMAISATETIETTDQEVIKDDEGEPIAGTISREDVIIDYKEYSPKLDITHEEAFNDKLKEFIIKGEVSPQQMRRLEKISKQYKTIPNPLTGEGTLDDATKVDSEMLAIDPNKDLIADIPMVADKTMLKSSLKDFSKKYTEEVMHRDIFGVAANLQRRGIGLQNYQIATTNRLGDSFETHSIKYVPIEGESSTVTFKVPKINSEGVFVSRGIKMMMKPQRRDVPIRKVSHDQVAMTSYTSKMFVERSQFSAYSSDRWIKSKLVMISDPDVQIRWGGVSAVIEGGGYDDKDLKSSDKTKAKLSKRTPLIYTQIGRHATSIKTSKYELFFDAGKLEENFGDEVVAAFEETRGTQILVGKGKNSLLVLTNNGNVFECDIHQKNNVELGSIESLLGIDDESKPFDCADVLMLSKAIPLGVLLGYYLGIGNLMKTLGASSRFVESGRRKGEIGKNELELRFSDGTLIVDVSDYRTRLIMSGFQRYKSIIKQYPYPEFDKATVYGSVFADAGLPGRFVREFSILRDLWVDPVTHSLLVEMGEPTDFVLLLMRAAEMLVYDQHPMEMDRAYQREVGYERVAGFIHEELVKSIRTYESTPVKSRAKVTMNPEAVWMKIISDDTTTPIEESNPIHSLKEQEIVVYGGAGGRSARTMNSESRRYSRNAIGVDSEVTVDNGDAGTVKYLTANPNYNSVRGTVNIIEDPNKEKNHTMCLNTSTLLAPGATLDAPPRRGFISIQNSRTTNSEGSHIAPVGTGYERVLPYRTGDLYATMATEEGKVVRVTENAVVVKYKSGKEITVELGKRDGKWAGKIIPHNVITTLKENQKVLPGEPIAFNPLFFEMDTLGGSLVYKSGVLCRVALVEEEFTFEDASEMSVKLANKLTTKNCEERFIVVDFDQVIEELVKVGDKVSYDSPLCIKRNSIEGLTDSFHGSSIDALKDISSLSPRAKHNGVITDITAVYVGDVSEMTPSLQTIVGASDRKLYRKSKDMGLDRITGQKKVGERYDGRTLEPNTVVIKITIDISQDMGVGSKVVYSHQMKSVVSNIWNEEFTTEDGMEYDAKFSYTSFIKRIVESGILLGILNTYIVETSKRAVEIYEKG